MKDAETKLGTLGAAPETTQAEPLETPDWTERFNTYTGQPPYVIEPWIPDRVVSSLYGTGGIGKTAVLMSIAARKALGRPVLQNPSKDPIKVVMITTEDSEHELTDRMRKIVKSLNLSPDEMDLLNENFVVPALADQNPSLVFETRDRVTGAQAVHQTLFWQQLLTLMDTHKPDWLILDPLADIANVNEIDRQVVTQFMVMLNNLARNRCAITLLGHPARSTDSDFSGSSAWNSKVRSRIWLGKDGDVKDRLVLEHRKLNATRAKAEPVLIEWEGGAPVELLPEDTEARNEMAATEMANTVYKWIKAKRVSKAAFTTQTAKGDRSLIKAAKQKGVSEAMLDAAVNRLLKEGLITVHLADGKDGRPKYTGNSGPLEVYVPTGEGDTKGGADV